MKRKNCVFEYREQLHKDLLRAYRELASSCRYTSMSALFKALVRMPSRRFWVSEERAAIVIASMMRGDTLSSMRPSKREMFMEIYRRCADALDKGGRKPLHKIVAEVVRQPAPQFYMTAGSAKVMFYNIRKNWRKHAGKKR